MSLVKDAIQSLAREGEITHKFSIKDVEFVLRPLEGEESFLADGMIDIKRIREKYGAENLLTLNDTIQKHRTIAQVALMTKTVNGQSPIDESLPLEEQYKQRLELRDELLSLPAVVIDQIVRETNIFAAKQQEFFSDLSENVEKS